MNKKGSIGFHQPEVDEPKAKTKDLEDEVLCKAINDNWAPVGNDHHMDFYSTLMIQSTLSEHVEVSLGKIAKTMEELGFKTTNIEGVIVWVVYLKNPDLLF